MDLPPNVRPVTDRHGKRRYRLRRKGLPSRYVSGEPGTAEFQLSYERCLDPNYQPSPRRRAAILHARPIKPPTTGSYVYFIGNTRGPVKIGVSVNVRARLKKLQTGHPTRLRVLALVEGGPELERDYHERFADLHVHGEWYAGAAIRDEIKRLRSTTKCPTYNPGWANVRQ